MNSLWEKDPLHLPPAEAFLYDTDFNKQQVPIDKTPGQQLVPQIRIEDLPDLRVAYIRSRGPYGRERILPSFHQLLQWAIPRGHITEGVMIFSVLWSHRGVTPEDKLIHDACLTIPEFVRADECVDTQILPGGKFAIHHCEAKPKDVEAIWMNLILDWLASSDYQPDDRPSYQIYYNRVDTPPHKYAVMDLCLPIKSLGD